MGTGNVRRFRRDKEGKGLGQDKEITKKGKGQEHGKNMSNWGQNQNLVV